MNTKNRKENKLTKIKNTHIHTNVPEYIELRAAIASKFYPLGAETQPYRTAALTFRESLTSIMSREIKGR